MNIIMICHIFCYRTLNTGRHEEILLFQAKFFSRNMIVIWIKHLTDRTCKVLLLYCFLIISFIKGIQIKGIDCFGIPDTKSIYNAIAISNYRNIIRNSLYRLVIFLYILISSVFRFTYSYITSEFYFHSILRTFHLKRIALFQPIIRCFYLKSILNLLFKHTILITDSTSIRRISQR